MWVKASAAMGRHAYGNNRKRRRQRRGSYCCCRCAVYFCWANERPGGEKKRRGRLGSLPGFSIECNFAPWWSCPGRSVNPRQSGRVSASLRARAWPTLLVERPPFAARKTAFPMHCQSNRHPWHPKPPYIPRHQLRSLCAHQIYRQHHRIHTVLLRLPPEFTQRH